MSISEVIGGERAWHVEQGDCLEVLKALPDNSVDAVVTDPPYGLGFMGREWDTFKPETVRARVGRKARKNTPIPEGHGAGESAGYVEYDFSLSGNQRFQAWCEQWARECLRVLKPGGHLVAFCGSRTYHRLASGVEDAGFEIRDKLNWIFGSGFPKSHNLDGEWEGWGSALKPAHEPIVLGRKPLIGTIAANVHAFGTGALNISGSRVGSDIRSNGPMSGLGVMHDDAWQAREIPPSVVEGRWPSNVLLSEEAAEEIDRQSGETGPSRIEKPCTSDQMRSGYGGSLDGSRGPRGYEDEGGASRFFPVFKYAAKADRAERDAGLEHLAPRTFNRVNPGGLENDPRWAPTQVKNTHPTVKPVDVMLWLVRLVTPPGGVVLDPFTGSGTTGLAATRMGWRFVGIEREAEYAQIARARIVGDAPLFNGLLGESA